jgi:hypothetical protein
VLLGGALCYRLAKDMSDSRTALAALIIFSTSDLLLSLTPEVRHYPFYMLLAAGSSFCLWRYAGGEKRAWGGAYVLCAAALMYTLYWGAFILLAHAAWALWRWRGGVWRQAWLAALVILLYLPWLPSLASQLGGENSNPVDEGGYANALRFDRLGAEIIFFQLFGLPEALLFGLSLGGLYWVWRGRWERGVFLGLGVYLPLGLAFASAAAGYSLLTHRPLIALIPPLAILAAYPLGQLPPWAYRLFLGIILLNNLTTTGATPPERADWPLVSAWVDEHLWPGDSVLIEAGLNAYSLEHHLRLEGAPAGEVLATFGRPPNRPLPRGGVWLVEFGREADLRPSLAEGGFLPLTPTLPLRFYVFDQIQVTGFWPAEALPTDPLVIFGGDLGLYVADIADEGEALRLRLLWDASRPAPRPDYTISVFVMDEAGRVVAQKDAPPLGGMNPTSAWAAGAYQLDPRYLSLPALPPGDYRLGLKAYYWGEGGLVQLTVPDCQAEGCAIFWAGELIRP